MSNRSSYYQLITCVASLLLIQTLGSTEAVIVTTATSAAPAFITTTPRGGGSSSISSRPSSSSWNDVASSSAFLGRKMTLFTPRCPKSTSSSRRSDTSLAMFLGQDSGILGVGAPEVVSQYYEMSETHYPFEIDTIFAKILRCVWLGFRCACLHVYSLIVFVFVSLLFRNFIGTEFIILRRRSLF